MDPFPKKREWQQESQSSHCGRTASSAPVPNNSGTDGKNTSGVALAYSFNGPYTYDKDSRYFELNGEVLSVNPKTGSTSFTSAERMAMPINCTEAE
jgi:hypothetical protein